MSWETAYRGTVFAQSANGTATWSYLLLKNGLHHGAAGALETTRQRVENIQWDLGRSSWFSTLAVPHSRMLVS